MNWVEIPVSCSILVDITTANSTRLMSLTEFPRNMNLEETVDYLAEEFNLERSEHVREAGKLVAELRD